MGRIVQTHQAVHHSAHRHVYHQLHPGARPNTAQVVRGLAHRALHGPLRALEQRLVAPAQEYQCALEGCDPRRDTREREPVCSKTDEFSRDGCSKSSQKQLLSQGRYNTCMAQPAAKTVYSAADVTRLVSCTREGGAQNPTRNACALYASSYKGQCMLVEVVLRLATPREPATS